jgi:hypothetical protein
MTLRLNGSTSGYTEIDAPAVAGNNTLVLPTGNGTSGQVLTTNGSGALSWADRMTAAGPAFSAYATTLTNTANATWTKVACVTEEFDTANVYDTGASRFTPNVAGYYQFSGMTGGSGPLNATICSLYKNGSELKRGVQSNGATLYYATVSAMLYLNGTTDYVELYWYQASGATQNNIVAAPYTTYFQGFLARPV